MHAADFAGRSLAIQAREDFPRKRSFPLTEIQAWHWLWDLIAAGLYELPVGSNLRDEVAKVYAAARTFWRELRHISENEVLQY